MKNTNAQTDKKTKIKIAIVVTTLVTGLFAIIGNNSIVQAAELIKAEPIKQINLYQEAKVSLALSFTSLTISQGDRGIGISRVLLINLCTFHCYLIECLTDS
jgi:hypothetical protein